MDKCHKVCSLTFPGQFYWIVAVCVADFLAIVFLCLVIFLSVRLYRERRSLVAMQTSNRYPIEDVYSEPDIRAGRDARVYMTLELRDRLRNVQCIHNRNAPNNSNYRSVAANGKKAMHASKQKFSHFHWNISRLKTSKDLICIIHSSGKQC